MASHFRIGNAPLFQSQAVSSTTTYHSKPFHILNLDNVYMQIQATGTMSGTFTVEISNDYEEYAATQAVIKQGTWIPVTLPTTPTLSGSAAQIGIDLNQLGAPWVRLSYTNASGSGTVNAQASGKGLM